MTGKNQIPMLTVAQFKALDKQIMAALTEMGPDFSVWLYNMKKADNYFKLRFAGEDCDFGFDLVFRKHDANPDIVCQSCGQTHITGTVESIK